MPKTNDELIKVVMKRFDFERVHKVMTLLGWKWAFNRRKAVPTIPELKDKALELLNKVLEKRGKISSLSTGGLMVEYDENDLTLLFIAEDVAVLVKTDEEIDAEIYRKEIANG